MVEVDNLHRSYGTGPRAVHALRGVSFEVPRGELVALKGRSGSGKTTLLNLLGGLDQPDEGTITVDGTDVGRWASRASWSCAATASASSSSPSASSPSSAPPRTWASRCGSRRPTRASARSASRCCSPSSASATTRAAPRRALRRPAAARRHRPRPRQPPRPAHRGRAHRPARRRHRPRGDGAAARRGARGGCHGPGRHPRQPAPGPRRPCPGTERRPASPITADPGRAARGPAARASESRQEVSSAPPPPHLPKLLAVRSTQRTQLNSERQWGHGTRQASDLPRRGAGRRQDVRHALRGPPPGRARHRLRRGAGRAPRQAAHRGDAARPRADPAPRDRLPRRRTSPRWTSTRSSSAAPAVALVDELAHTNVPGAAQRQALAGRRGAARRRHRRHVHGQHPAPGIPRRRRRVDHRRTPARDRARRGGAPGRPDRARRHVAPGAAPPHGARQRLPADKVDAALSNYFRPGNLTALRELALLWVADRVDEYLQQYRGEHGIPSTWQARERIVVGLTGGPEGAHPDPPGRPHRRQGLRQRAAGGATWRRSDGLASASPKELDRPAHPRRGPGRQFPPRHRRRRPLLAARLRARRQRHPDRARLQPAQGLAVHLRPRRRARPWPATPAPTSTSTSSPTSRPRTGGACPVARGAPPGPGPLVWGWAVGVLGPAAAHRAAHRRRRGLGPRQRHAALPVADGGGGAARRPAPGARVGRGRLAAPELLLHPARPPAHDHRPARTSWPSSSSSSVAVSVASVVDLAARRTHQAARLRAESRDPLLPGGQRAARRDRAWTPCSSGSARPSRMESVALLERASDVEPWTCAAAWGPARSPGPRTRTWTCRSATTWRSPCRAACCPPRTAGCSARSPPRPPWSWTAAGWRARPTQARALAEGNRIRTALLAAVSHDLRTPLASIKAAGHARCAPTTSSGPRRTRPSSSRASRPAPTASTT